MESPASTLARRCAALMDADMRVAYVRHALREMAPEEMVALVAELLRRRTPAHADALLTVSLALGSAEVDAARTAAARRAAKDGLPDVVALLGSHEDATPELGELRVPDFGRGRPLTLGERKTLARRRDRQLLGRVLRDPHPDVIQVLLGNPALTEEDVVRLAADSHVSPCPQYIDQFFVLPPIREDIGDIGSIDTSSTYRFLSRTVRTAQTGLTLQWLTVTILISSDVHKLNLLSSS